MCGCPFENAHIIILNCKDLQLLSLLLLHVAPIYDLFDNESLLKSTIPNNITVPMGK